MLHLPTHVIERASTTVPASGREPRALAERRSEPVEELLEPVDYRAPSSGAGPDAAAIPGIARAGPVGATSTKVACVAETSGPVASAAGSELDAAPFLGASGSEGQRGERALWGPIAASVPESTPSESCGSDGRWDTSSPVALLNMSSMSNLQTSSHPGRSSNTPQKRRLRHSSPRHSLRRNHSHWSSGCMMIFSEIRSSCGEMLGNHHLVERRHCSLRSKLGVLNNSRTGSLRSKPGGTRHASFDSVKVPTTPKWGRASTSLSNESGD